MASLNLLLFPAQVNVVIPLAAFGQQAEQAESHLFFLEIQEKVPLDINLNKN